ncbi:MAG: choice-of-anchor M domain-containing protein [Verrucomicrobiae bacterium]|nr:choice-of-anchor M domain-containing protein [Verrucomicrobiae bacterium]
MKTGTLLRWIGAGALALAGALAVAAAPTPPPRYHLESAYDMNNAGQIVGWGRKDGNTRGFLLTPAPGRLYAMGGYDPEDTGMVPHRIYELDPVTGKATPLTGSFGPEPAGLAATADGRILALNVEHHHHHGEEPPPAESALVEIDPYTGFLTKLATVPVEAYGFDILPDGRAFTIPLASEGTFVQLHLVNLETGAAVPVGSASAINEAFAAAFGSEPASNTRATQLASVGDHLYAAVRHGTLANLVRMDPDTGAATVMGAANAVNTSGGGAYFGIPGLSGRDSNGDGQFDELYGVLNYHDHDGDPETYPQVVGALIRFNLNDGTWSIVGTNPGLLFSGLASTAELNPASLDRLVYRMEEISGLGGPITLAMKLNDKGAVTGSSDNSDGGYNAYRHQAGQTVPLAPLGGELVNNSGLGINNHGTVVGNSESEDWSKSMACVYTNGLPFPLGTLGGANSFASGINHLGHVVGWAENAAGEKHGFLWRDGAMADLGPPGMEPSEVWGINDMGEVITTRRVGDGRQGSVRQAGTGEWVNLGTLGGTNSNAQAINARGHIVGGAQDASGHVHPYLWRNGVMTDLGSLGGPSSQANGLNDSDMVVGSSGSSSGQRAFLSVGNRILDLNERVLRPAGLDYPLEIATDINNQGQIVGFSFAGAGSKAWLLSPSVRFDHGELDIGLAYHDGELEFHVHDEVNGVEYGAPGVVLAVGTAAEQPIPDTLGFQFLGRPGHSVWILPAVEDEALLFLGLAAEEIESGIFVNNALRVELVSVEGAGAFFLYTTDPFGAPQVHMNSADGIGSADFFALTAGSHQHVNWVFGAPGTYRIGLRATGTRIEGSELVASEVIHFTFNVPAAQRPQPEEPDDRFVYKVDLIEVTDAGYIAGEDLNELGEVAVGAYDAGNRPMAGRFSETFTPLAPLTSAGAYASGINDAGVVVGWGLDDGGLRRPLMWSNGLATDLGTLGGDRGEARAVNLAGRVVGQARNAAAEPRAFQWTAAGGMTELPMTLGGNRSSASAINDAGLVAGSGRLPDNLTHAVRYDPVSGTTLDLGTLGGANSFANGINGAGHVVGLSDASDGTFRPFYWSPETGMMDLFAGGDLGVPSGSAYDINAAGEVVGYGGINDDFDSHAFVWSAGAGLRDLNELVVRMSGLELHGAAGINDAGQITGWGAMNGRRVGYRLSPATRLKRGEVDVGLEWHDGELEFHAHDHAADIEYAADAVVFHVPALGQTEVPASPAFAFLGAPGAPVWILPQTEDPKLLFLGLGAEEVDAGVFVNDRLELRLARVEGPGQFAVFSVDGLGQPVVHMNSGDGIDAGDIKPLQAGSHEHVNWAFTAPGVYRVTFRAAGTLVEGGAVVESEAVEFCFEVIGGEPRLMFARDGGQLVLSLRTEDGLIHQIEQATALNGPWTAEGAAFIGTGRLKTVGVAADNASRFFRVRSETP